MTVEVIVLLAAAATGAAVARALNLPIWAITGSIVGTATMQLALDVAVEFPPWLTVAAQVLVGTAIGSQVSPTLLRDLRRIFIPAALTVLSIVLAGIALGIGISVAGLADPVAGVLGAIPGGAGEMVAAAAALRADTSLVAAMHVIRVLIVFAALPSLLRWFVRHVNDAEGDH